MTAAHSPTSLLLAEVLPRDQQPHVLPALVPALVLRVGPPAATANVIRFAEALQHHCLVATAPMQQQEQKEQKDDKEVGVEEEEETAISSRGGTDVVTTTSGGASPAPPIRPLPLPPRQEGRGEGEGSTTKKVLAVLAQTLQGVLVDGRDRVAVAVVGTGPHGAAENENNNSTATSGPQGQHRVTAVVRSSSSSSSSSSGAAADDCSHTVLAPLSHLKRVRPVPVIGSSSRNGSSRQPPAPAAVDILLGAVPSHHHLHHPLLRGERDGDGDCMDRSHCRIGSSLGASGASRESCPPVPVPVLLGPVQEAFAAWVLAAASPAQQQQRPSGTARQKQQPPPPTSSTTTSTSTPSTDASRPMPPPPHPVPTVAAAPATAVGPADATPPALPLPMPPSPVLAVFVVLVPGRAPERHEQWNRANAVWPIAGPRPRLVEPPRAPLQLPEGGQGSGASAQVPTMGASPANTSANGSGSGSSSPFGLALATRYVLTHVIAPLRHRWITDRRKSNKNGKQHTTDAHISGGAPYISAVVDLDALGQQLLALLQASASATATASATTNTQMPKEAEDGAQAMEAAALAAAVRRCVRAVACRGIHDVVPSPPIMRDDTVHREGRPPQNGIGRPENAPNHRKEDPGGDDTRRLLRWWDDQHQEDETEEGREEREEKGSETAQAAVAAAVGTTSHLPFPYAPSHFTAADDVFFRALLQDVPAPTLPPMPSCSSSLATCTGVCFDGKEDDEANEERDRPTMDGNLDWVAHPTFVALRDASIGAHRRLHAATGTRQADDHHDDDNDNDNAASGLNRSSSVSGTATPAAVDAAVSPSSSYLCNGLDVVTTVEPCLLCAMACVHSRVRRVIYTTPNPANGGFSDAAATMQEDLMVGPEGSADATSKRVPSGAEDGFFLHTIKSLNHSFEVYEARLE